MSLLEDFEGAAELERSTTGSPLMEGEWEEEGFQLHRPKDKKDKRSRLAEEGKKSSTLSLRRGKQKDKEISADKTPKRGKHVRAKSGSRTPPDSPKATRTVDNARKPGKPGVSQLQPSPNVKSTRKRYAVLGKADVSSDSESEEEVGLMVLNQAAATDDYSSQLVPDTKTAASPEVPPSPPFHQTLIPPPTSPTQRAAVQFPVPFSLQPDTTTVTNDRPGITEGTATTQEQLSPGQPPLGYPSEFFHSPMPPLQPVSVASGPPPPTEDDWAISDELRQKCKCQFAELQPENGLLLGDKAREFFIQSKLPNSELSQIWFVDSNSSHSALQY